MIEIGQQFGLTRQFQDDFQVWQANGFAVVDEGLAPALTGIDDTRRFRIGVRDTGHIEVQFTQVIAVQESEDIPAPFTAANDDGFHAAAS